MQHKQYFNMFAGYMNRALFTQWFLKIFIPNCGVRRPVLLVMDNHDSHISLEILEGAIENKVIAIIIICCPLKCSGHILKLNCFCMLYLQIELLTLPPHTTHIMQPLDVAVLGPLKKKFSSLALSTVKVKKDMTIGRDLLPNVKFISKSKIYNIIFPQTCYRGNYQFVFYYYQLWSAAIKATCTKKFVMSSFRRSGLYPVDMTVC